MRDPGLRDRGTEIQVGALIILTAIILVAGLFWISGSPFRGPSVRISGLAADAGQITPDSKVFLRGVEVGNVDAVRLEATHVLLSLTLYAGVDVPADTRGDIKPAGFLGQQMIDLVPGVATRPLVAGDTIPLGRTSDLMSMASSLSDDTGVLLERVEAILSERLVDNLVASSEAFTVTMQELEDLMASERDAVHSLLANMNEASGRLAALTGSEELDRSLANLDTLSTRLATASEHFDETSRSLATITTRLSEGQGTLGKMLTDDELYDGLAETLANLQAASEEIALLTQDIRERPERYLKDIKVSVF